MATTTMTTTTTTTPSSRSSPPSATTTTTTTRPRRSSSLHKAAIARLRPMPFQYIWAAWHSKPQGPTAPTGTGGIVGTRTRTALATVSEEEEGEGEEDNEQKGSLSSPRSYILTQLIDQMPDIAAFYRVFNNIPWTAVRTRESIHFFRAGVKPLWEDGENVEGGCLVLKVRKDGGRAVRAWEEVCLMACGGQLQASVTQERDHVLGISFSPRLYWVHISIWTKQGGNQRSIQLLTQSLLAGLSPDLRPKSNDDYYFKRHSDHSGWADIVKAKKTTTTTTVAAM